MRRLTALILSFALSVAAVPAFAAAPICYSADEAAAEQLIRLHSELMVIAVTCKYGPGNVSLFDAYAGFGRSHNAALRSAEANMIAYYKRSGKQGIAELDRLRTVLGNEYSNEAAQNDTQEWCNRISSQMVDAATWSEPHLQQVVMQKTKASHMDVCPATTIQGATKQAALIK